MFEFSVYNLIVFLLATAAAIYIWRRTALRAMLFLDVHHKTALLALVTYFLLVWGIQYFALTYFPQPRGWVINSAVFVGDSARNVWKAAPQLANDAGTAISSGVANTFEQLMAAIPELPATVEPASLAPEQNALNPALEVYCVAIPGDGFTSVYLRKLPDWDEAEDINDPAYRVDPNTMVQVYGKLICLDAAGDSETWFEVRAVDGGRRVVNDARCRLDNVDVGMLPDTNWQSANGTNLCTSYQ